MDVQTIKIDGIELSIPSYYQQVERMPADPENCLPFLVQSEHALCLLRISLITPEQSIPLDVKVSTAAIRSYLTDKQGLIEVNGGPGYIYSIVKTLLQEGDVQYVLTYERHERQGVLFVQGFFEEIGTTGIRDNLVYQKLRASNLVGSEEDPFEGWARDPYDESFKTGALMNCSELEEYDRYFPDFPLSLCRTLVRTICSTSE